jgi:carbon starvation protein
MLNAAVIGILGAAWFYVMYRWYGGIIDRRLIHPNDDRATPANTRRDNVDFVPSRPAILFGHHFSSIAGAGPIVGPMFAYFLFGWLPALLWIVVGSVFAGAVHDYTSMMTSVRSGGVSIAEIAQRHVSDTARWIFTVFLWLALVLVIAVFAVLTAQTLAEKPEIVVPTIGLMLLAMAFGSLVYRGSVNLIVGTVVALVLLLALIVLGDLYPIQASFEFWLVFALVYSLFAATLPVWFLLQPRDYISMYILLVGLVLGFGSILVLRPEITGPAFIGFSSSNGPLWPILFITVACGAVSGFHSVVSSGTSAKQLRRESDGKIIAFGGMLTEGILALLVLLLMTGVLTWDKAGPGGEGFVFRTLLSEQGANITFGAAMGRALEAIGVPLVYGTAFGILMLNAFILTTLDTCARLTRFIVTESIGQKVALFRNRFLATIPGLAFAFILTLGNNWKVLWPAFGAANQLIAALALLVVSAYMFGYKRRTRYTLIPGIFMLVTTEGALFYQLFWQYVPTGNIILGVVATLLMLLGVVVAVEVYRRLRRTDQEVPAEGQLAAEKV